MKIEISEAERRILRGLVRDAIRDTESPLKTISHKLDKLYGLKAKLSVVDTSDKTIYEQRAISRSISKSI